MFYLFVYVRLVNYGGHAVLEPLKVTGRPAVETRPLDIWGLMPGGGQMPFLIRFDVGNVKAPDLRPEANVLIRARAQRMSEWNESLYFVSARYEPRAGWQVQITQPAPNSN